MQVLYKLAPISWDAHVLLSDAHVLLCDAHVLLSDAHTCGQTAKGKDSIRREAAPNHFVLHK